MLTAGLAVCIIGVALAAPVYDFTWKTECNSGNWNNGSCWDKSEGAPDYPDGTNHNVTIEGRSSPERAISLVNADVRDLTLKNEEITFDSRGANGKTISISAVVTIQGGEEDYVIVILTDEASLDSAG